MKYKVEVIADRSGKWCGNGLTFDTRETAEWYARDLAGRWFMVEQWRVVEVPADVVVGGGNSRAEVRV